MAAVMCIGETKHSPSVTPLLRTICSTWSVMCTISLRFLVSKTRYSVWLFIAEFSPMRPTHLLHNLRQFLQPRIPRINAPLIFSTQLSQPDWLVLRPRALLVQHVHQAPFA